MKVAYLISEYPKRSHTFIRREIAELRRRGVDIHVLAIRRPELSELLCEHDWVDYRDTTPILPTTLFHLLKVHLGYLLFNPIRYIKTIVAAFKHRNRGIKSITWSLFYFAEAILLVDQLKKQNIYHLHVHFANAGANLGYLVSIFNNCTWSMTLHGLSDFTYPALPLLGDKLKSVSFANCISNYGRAHALLAVDSEHWHKIFISRCGIELRDLPNIVEYKKNKIFNIICVGRLSSEKAHLGLIEAFSQVLQKIDNVKLTLLGDGPEREKIEEKIKEYAIENKVTLLGHVSEESVLVKLANADLAVSSSLMEGIPIALMEAMALKVPVVAPRIAGIPELVDDNISGLLFTPTDWAEMAEKMIQLIENDTLRERLIKNGHEKVLAQYTITKSIVPLWKQLKQYI